MLSGNLKPQFDSVQKFRIQAGSPSFHLIDSKCQFEPIHKSSNRDRFKFKLLQGRRECEFEPLTRNKEFAPENMAVDTRIEKHETANGKIIDCIAKSKKKTVTVQKYSNHIEFIDYIPTHEVITYRHLFAYGFYVE